MAGGGTAAGNEAARGAIDVRCPWAIAEFRTGAPYGMVEQTNTSNTFSAGQRPNLLRDPEISGSRSRGETIAGYFDTTAFQAPAESSAARHAWPASGPG